MTYPSASSTSASPDKPRLNELTVFGNDKTAPNSHAQDTGSPPLGTGKAMPHGTAKTMPFRNSKGATALAPTDPSPEHHSPAHDDPGQRVAALQTLGQQRSPALETTLDSALDDPQEEVRATALEVLRDIRTAVPVERLT
jgi:hypothetical protein